MRITRPALRRLVAHPIKGLSGSRIVWHGDTLPTLQSFLKTPTPHKLTFNIAWYTSSNMQQGSQPVSASETAHDTRVATSSSLQISNGRRIPFSLPPTLLLPTQKWSQSTSRHNGFHEKPEQSRSPSRDERRIYRTNWTTAREEAEIKSHSRGWFPPSNNRAVITTRSVIRPGDIDRLILR